jgi:hypothetical protein
MSMALVGVQSNHVATSEAPAAEEMAAPRPSPPGQPNAAACLGKIVADERSLSERVVELGRLSYGPTAPTVKPGRPWLRASQRSGATSVEPSHHAITSGLVFTTMSIPLVGV